MDKRERTLAEMLARAEEPPGFPCGYAREIEATIRRAAEVARQIDDDMGCLCARAAKAILADAGLKEKP